MSFGGLKLEDEDRMLMFGCAVSRVTGIDVCPVIIGLVQLVVFLVHLTKRSMLSAGSIILY